MEQPLRSKKCVWQKLLSKQRKRAVVACFRMAPLYNLPRYPQLHLLCLSPSFTSVLLYNQGLPLPASVAEVNYDLEEAKLMSRATYSCYTGTLSPHNIELR